MPNASKFSLFYVKKSTMSILPANIPFAYTTLVHHVFFWLKEPGNAAHRNQLMEGLNQLAAIPQVKQLLVGTAAPTEQRTVVDGSFDVSELMFFNTVEDQAAYQQHPLHLAFVAQYSHLWQKVVVYDMLVA
jgi:hypothetical protein